MPKSASSYFASAEAASRIHLGTSTSDIDEHGQHPAEEEMSSLMFVS